MTNPPSHPEHDSPPPRRRSRRLLARILLNTATVVLLVLCVVACVALARSIAHPQFWVTQSIPAPYMPGDRGEARFFRGYYLSAGRFGRGEVRLYRNIAELGWPFERPKPAPPPEQAILLSEAGRLRGLPGTWAVPLAPLALLCAAPVAYLLGKRIFSAIRTNRRASTLCPICGYDLRATPDRCPECGAVSAKA